jgi:hypothetical protein
MQGKHNDSFEEVYYCKDNIKMDLKDMWYEDVDRNLQMHERNDMT